MSVLKQYEQPVEQKELALQVMSKASRTVPDSGEMLHEGVLGSAGASVVTPESAAGSAGSGPGIGKVYLAKPGSSLPVKKKNIYFVSFFQSQKLEEFYFGLSKTK